MMKKVLLKTAFIFVIALTFSACSATKGGSNTVSRGKISGNWVVNSVTLEGLLTGSVQSVFNTAPYKCFEGSIWQLTNSGNGSFTLNNLATDCPQGLTQSIYWSFATGASGPEFQFKKLYEKDKPKNVEEGYRLLVTAADGNSLTLKSPIAYGGKTGYVVYNLVKK